MIFFLSIAFYIDSFGFFFQCYKDIVILSPHLYCFQQEICWYPYIYTSISKFLWLILRFFSLSLILRNLIFMHHDAGFSDFLVSCWGSWICELCISSNLENVWPLFLHISFLCSVFFCVDSTYTYYVIGICCKTHFLKNSLSFV